MAMAVFTIIALIMMRFFSSAQQIYSKVSQRNNTFSDARIALDMMARELQCSLYNNSPSPQGIYPFWFEKVRDINDNYYTTFEQTQLNFIATTDMKPAGAISNICEIRYGFVPAGPLPPAVNLYKIDSAYSAETNAAGAYVAIDEGWLVRSCTADKVENPLNSGIYIDDSRWNFYLEPYKNATGIVINNNRVIDVFNEVMPATSRYRKVIPGVYALKFTCFIVDPNPLSANYLQLVPLKAMKGDINGTLSVGGTFGTQSIGAPPPLPDPQNGNINTLVGTPFPVAIKIDLSVMQPSDWREWHQAVDSGDTSTANKIKQQRMRTFSRTVFLDSKVSN